MCSHMKSTNIGIPKQTRFPTTSKNIPETVYGSLKTYPILEKEKIVRSTKGDSVNEESTQLSNPSFNTLSAHDGSAAHYVDFMNPPKAGVFIMQHRGGSAYFSYTWDSEREEEKQRELLKSGKHPSKGEMYIDDFFLRNSGPPSAHLPTSRARTH